MSPVIDELNPPSGKRGDECKHFEIRGKNFSSPRTVKLVLQKNDRIGMELTDIVSSATRILGKLYIQPSQETGPYACIVVNDDGGENRLDNAFTVT